MMLALLQQPKGSDSFFISSILLNQVNLCLCVQSFVSTRFSWFRLNYVAILWSFVSVWKFHWRSAVTESCMPRFHLLLDQILQHWNLDHLTSIANTIDPTKVWLNFHICSQAKQTGKYCGRLWGAAQDIFSNVGNQMTLSINPPYSQPCDWWLRLRNQLDLSITIRGKQFILV